MKRFLTAWLSAVFALAPFAASAATVTPINGQVLINQGNGYISISGPTVVNPGDTVMVYPGGSAQLSYSTGCNVVVQQGTVASVSPSSPCSPNPDPTLAEAVKEGAVAKASGIDFTTLAVGAGVIAGAVGLALAAGGGGSDDKKKTKPASP